MLKKYYKFILLWVFLFISGCFQVLSCESRFSINELPDAIFNKPYYQKIEISGGAMASENSINWEIIPENSGINIKKTIDKNSTLYSGVEISGIPIYKGDIKIRLYGYGSPPSGCTFDKVMILKVISSSIK